MIFGPMAEWLGKGLQNPVRQFKSASDLNFCPGGGMVDTRDLKSLDRKVMRVRVSPRVLS